VPCRLRRDPFPFLPSAAYPAPVALEAQACMGPPSPPRPGPRIPSPSFAAPNSRAAESTNAAFPRHAASRRGPRSKRSSKASARIRGSRGGVLPAYFRSSGGGVPGAAGPAPLEERDWDRRRPATMHTTWSARTARSEVSTTSLDHGPRPKGSGGSRDHRPTTSSGGPGASEALSRRARVGRSRSVIPGEEVKNGTV